MTTFNSIEELKTESQTVQEIAADYFHLAQKADRESIYSSEFDSALKAMGVSILKTPFRAPQGECILRTVSGEHSA